MKSSVLDTLGPRFSGTLIEDPVLDPFFITADSGGGYTVHKKRTAGNGQLKFSDVCYPGTFQGCLQRITKEKLNEPGKAFTSLEEYLNRWDRISQELQNALNSRGI